MHQIRSSMKKYIPYEDRELFIADLKGIYRTTNEEVALENLLSVKEK